MVRRCFLAYLSLIGLFLSSVNSVDYKSPPMSNFAVNLIKGGSTESQVFSTSPAQKVEIRSINNNTGLLICNRNTYTGGNTKDSGMNIKDSFTASVDKSGNNTLKLSQADAIDSDLLTNNGQGLLCDGIFGIYRLPAGYYMALITESEAIVGDDSPFPKDSGVREIKKISLVKIPYNDQSADIDASVEEENKTVLEMLWKTLYRHQFYFVLPQKSHLHFDVTRNLRSQSLIRQHYHHLSWYTCDERFFWNLNAVGPLIQSGLDQFIVPTTNAFITSRKFSLSAGSKASVPGNKKSSRRKGDFVLSLISRRSRHRQGQRYIKRGSDEEGDVANFVEIEQILSSTTHDKVFSFVQIRGSIPIFWSQPEAWKLKPEVVPERNLMMHARSVKTHLLDLFYNYFLDVKSSKEMLIGEDNNTGSQTREGGKWNKEKSVMETRKKQDIPQLYFINLIDKKGHQGYLGRWLVAAFQKVHMGGVAALSRTKGLYTKATQRQSYFDDLPSRVERDSKLKRRDVLTNQDYKCSITNHDLKKILGLDVIADTSMGTHTFAAAKTETNSILTTRYIWFDYHYKCKKGNVNAIRDLFPLLNSALQNASYTAFDSAYASINSVLEHMDESQKFIVRTNCVDCLDRTNVVQAVVGRWALLRQLRSLGYLSIPKLSGEQDSKEDYLSLMTLPEKDLESLFRSMWGDNGDAMSMLYAGTPALKRDVTRTGKRTNQGVFDDGVNSAMRYFINNYRDESTQAAIDFTLKGNEMMQPAHVDADMLRSCSSDEDKSSKDSLSQHDHSGIVHAVHLGQISQRFVQHQYVRFRRMIQEGEKPNNKSKSKKPKSKSKSKSKTQKDHMPSKGVTKPRKKGFVSIEESNAGKVLKEGASASFRMRKNKKAVLQKLKTSLEYVLQNFTTISVSIHSKESTQQSITSTGGGNGNITAINKDFGSSNSTEFITSFLSLRDSITVTLDELKLLCSKIDVKVDDANTRSGDIVKETPVHKVTPKHQKQKEMVGKTETKWKAAVASKTSTSKRTLSNLKTRPTKSSKITAARAKSLKLSIPTKKRKKYKLEGDFVLPDIIESPILPSSKSSLLNSIFKGCKKHWKTIVLLFLSIFIRYLTFPSIVSNVNGKGA